MKVESVSHGWRSIGTKDSFHAQDSIPVCHDSGLIEFIAYIWLVDQLKELGKNRQ